MNAPKAVKEIHRPETCKAHVARLPSIMLRIAAPIPSPSSRSCFRTTGFMRLAVALLRFHRRLGRGQPRHRHAVRRAADVVQTQRVAKLDRGRVTAVLATDADLHIG